MIFGRTALSATTQATSAGHSTQWAQTGTPSGVPVWGRAVIASGLTSPFSVSRIAPVTGSRARVPLGPKPGASVDRRQDQARPRVRSTRCSPARGRDAGRRVASRPRREPRRERQQRCDPRSTSAASPAPDEVPRPGEASTRAFESIPRARVQYAPRESAATGTSGLGEGRVLYDGGESGPLRLDRSSSGTGRYSARRSTSPIRSRLRNGAGRGPRSTPPGNLAVDLPTPAIRQSTSEWRRRESNPRPWSQCEGVYRLSRRLILVSRGPRRRALRKTKPPEMSPGGEAIRPGEPVSEAGAPPRGPREGRLSPT